MRLAKVKIIEKPNIYLKGKLVSLMKNIKEKLEEKTNEDLIKMAKLKGIKNYDDMDRKELIKKLVDQYEKNYSTTC